MRQNIAGGREIVSTLACLMLMIVAIMALGEPGAPVVAQLIETHTTVN